MARQVTAVDLFAGIGGISLGMQRAGIRVIGQVEIDPFCQRVLAKHWPEVARHGDVRTAVEWWQGKRRPRVDIVAGGFPCQPYSLAGEGLGSRDSRSLWPFMLGFVKAVQPRAVLAENVLGLRTRGLAGILYGLTQAGYAARAGIIRACEVGAPHSRPRLFIVAHANGIDGKAWLGPGRELSTVFVHFGSSRAWPDPENGMLAASTRSLRMAHGIPNRVDRVTALGNSVVPQVAEHMARVVLAGLR